MTQKNRITYRFDRNGQAVTGDGNSLEKQRDVSENKPDEAGSTAPQVNRLPKKNVIPLYPTTEQHSMSEVSPWNSPFQEDIAALEELIRNADTVPAANNVKAIKQAVIPPIERIEKEDPYKDELYLVKKEKKAIDEEAAFPVHEELDDIQAHAEERIYEEPRRGKAQYSRIKRGSSAPSWFNVFLSVAAALATGALFGYLLLSLFTGASLFPSEAGNKPDAQPVTGSVAAGDKGSETGAIDKNSDTSKPATVDGSGGQQGSTAATISLTGLEHTYFMLQFGVFSNTEGKDAALDQLAKQGLAAAAMTSAKDYRVYAGLGSDRKQAEAIKGLLPEIELYVKEVTIDTPGKLPFTGDSAVAQRFFEQTGILVQMLDELTLAQLEQPTFNPLSKTAASSWQAEHKEWTENAAAMRIGIGDADGKAYLEQIIQAVNSAAESMVEYDKKPSQAHLWSSQTGIMRAVIAQKEWFESISAL
ncbi:hypothetical protein FHS16_000209 [Paenibacillus endophyticus]|uniref:SPOR domain-containing protein n=1 Tax=Paenibacillus endophyticus TaxID=1294268 RepID=A0A7W5G8Q8_9BACL|nr:SPOR domain-containing protein [Paenibacillus endophyticus]MBB3150177.1 hypothetical protein [Paenibacillus endophyticus]